jgi:geranylgeranyl pyrophosphate synthase
MKVKISTALPVPEQIRIALGLTVRKLSLLDKKDFLIEELTEPATHLLRYPGKLVRSGLLFTSAVALGQRQEDFVDLAAAIELIHTASLIHDDLVDDDSIRRGVEAVHSRFGIEKAVLSGDALIAKGVNLASKYGAAVVSRASEASMAMCAGEILDMKFQKEKTPVSIDQYLDVARLKTATFMAVSSSIVADCISHSAHDTLYQIGLNIGLSFQIRDDIMNYLGVEEPGRKPVNTDAIGFRPNVISAMLNIRRQDALMDAVALNNKFLDEADALLVHLEHPELFRQYIEFLRIKWIESAKMELGKGANKE